MQEAIEVKPIEETATATASTAPTATPATPAKTGTSTGMTVVTILLLLFLPLIGVIVMWAATKWSKAVKWIITILYILGTIIGLFVFSILFVAIMAAVNPSAQIERAEQVKMLQTYPQTVVIDANAPLTCTKLDVPKPIEAVPATYSCAAPGAYLESVDVTAMKAMYFTTDTQGMTITYGPAEKTIIEVQP